MRLILIRIKVTLMHGVSSPLYFSTDIPQTRIWPVRQKSRAVKPSEIHSLSQDTAQFSRVAAVQPSPIKEKQRPDRYQPKLPIGVYGLPQDHIYYDVFRDGRDKGNLPGVAKMHSVKSLDPSTKDPSKAYACEVMLDMRGTQLFGKTTPGEHLSLLDISNSNRFKPGFIQSLRFHTYLQSRQVRSMKDQGRDYKFTEQDLARLAKADLKNFTIASPMGGERDQYGNPNGLLKLIVRRVGPLTNYLASRKPGDPMVFAAPISHHFVGPTAQTPALFIGLGSSITPYESMLRTRFELEKGPYADTYLAMGHRWQEFEYDGDMMRGFEKNADHHFTYRPVFSKQPEKSDGIKYVQSLIQKPEEARKIFSIVLNPKAQIFISGIIGIDEEILGALKDSARNNPKLGVSEETIEAAWNLAKSEDRLHAEGTIRKDEREGLQGY
jgi:hypothetical protein